MKIRRLYCTVDDCKKTFRSEDQLLIHLTTHELSEEESEVLNFQCEICLVKFSTKRSVSAHKRVHKKDAKQCLTLNMTKILTQKIQETNRMTAEIPDLPFKVQDLKIPIITGPSPTVLPLFSTILHENL